MSLDEGFEDFYDEFKEWTKKQILHRTYDICLENADKDKEIERLNNIINELEDIIKIKLIREINEDDYMIKANDFIELLDKIQELRRVVIMNKMKWREVAVDPMINLESFLDSQEKTIERLKEENQQLKEDIKFCINTMKNEYECTDKRTNRELHTMVEILEKSTKEYK